MAINGKIVIVNGALVDGLQWTIDNNCSAVRYYSNLITDFDEIAYSLQLTITNLFPETDATATSVISLTLADIQEENSVKFYEMAPGVTKGLFKVVLTSKDTNGATLQNQTVCLYVSCDIQCELESASIEGIMHDYALNRAAQCACQECEELKPMYSALLTELGLGLDTDCPCNKP